MLTCFVLCATTAHREGDDTAEDSDEGYEVLKNSSDERQGYEAVKDFSDERQPPQPPFGVREYSEKEAGSILEELTLTNSEKESNELAHLEIQEPEALRGHVSIIFDKALEEGLFCKMYAGLCNFIKDQMKEFHEVDPAFPRLDGGENSKVKKVTFKRCLLNKCQEEFERADCYNEMNDEETMGLDDTAKASKTRRVRNRMLGNIKFIGQLFAQKILNGKIMHGCVKRPLENIEEDTIECLCTLMARKLNWR
jgi:translation initiation factor 4G